MQNCLVANENVDVVLGRLLVHQKADQHCQVGDEGNATEGVFDDRKGQLT